MANFDPSHAGAHVPGQPARIPIEPRPGLAVFGALLLGVGGWFAFSWIPAHRPLEPGDMLVSNVKDLRVFTEQRLNPNAYPVAWGLAVLLMTLGLGALLSALTWKNYAEVVCRRCKQRVVAKKATFGLRCPVGEYSHFAAHSWGRTILVLIFFLLVAPVLLRAIVGGPLVVNLGN